MPLIFIECGTSLRSSFHTGIQRVVRNIVRESETLSPSLGCQCIQVSYKGSNFHLLQATDLTLPAPNVSFATRFFQSGVAIYRSFKRRVPPSVHQRILQTVTILQQIRWIRWLLVGKAQLPPTIHEILQNMRNSETTSIAAASPPILLLLDSTWNMRFWPAVDKFRAAGGLVSAVLYDLIPFTHPDTVEDHTRNAHTSWWLEAPKHIDSLICISKTVRDQYLLWQEQNSFVNRLSSEQVSFFYLGSELTTTQYPVNNERDALSRKNPFFLVVGSIEPRKNHTVILNAFDELWRQGLSINLVIVGSHGWKSETLLSRITNHPMLNQRLFLLRTTTDAELADLYNNTTGLIIASIAEGFGLPIVEAFQRGTRVICSDIPVFREIAGERAVYFDPNNHNELANKLDIVNQRAIINPQAQKDTLSWLTWRESTEQLLRELIQLK
jgi:O-antigen biosynthesis alpha-1,2-rhamnosyltransferase